MVGKMCVHESVERLNVVDGLYVVGRLAQMEMGPCMHAGAIVVHRQPVLKCSSGICAPL